MANYSDRFNKLLEKYLFQISLQVIDLTDTETQDKLINLIRQVQAASGPIEEKSPGQNDQLAASEWAQVLDKPIDHQSVYNQWLICVTRDRARRQETYIAQLEDAIRFTQQQDLRIRTQTSAGAIQFSQLLRNRVILEQQQHYLAVAHRAKKVISDQLSRLVNQRKA